MTTAERARATGPVLHPRVCAAVTSVSCLVHLWVAASGRHGLWLGLLMLVLAAVCVPCAVHIWQHSRVSALQRVMVCALAMVALHLMLLVGGITEGHRHLTHHSDQGSTISQAGTLLAIVGLELVTGLLAATLLARLRSTHTRHCAVAAEVAQPSRHNASGPGGLARTDCPCCPIRSTSTGQLAARAILEDKHGPRPTPATIAAER